jgi:hypothetical protein
MCQPIGYKVTEVDASLPVTRHDFDVVIFGPASLLHVSTWTLDHFISAFAYCPGVFAVA